jgi:indolepyruvate ferredoxin oxidoreductase
MVIVVEEKRSLIEVQVREELYGTAMPAVMRRQEGRARRLALPRQGRARSQRHRHRHRRAGAAVIGPSDEIAGRVDRMKQFQAMLADTRTSPRARPISARAARTTPRPGARGLARLCGIGCHFMALWMDRSPSASPQMGGEGAQWVGQAPFSKREPHVPESRRRHLQPFRLAGAALRVASGANVTYKILYNDAVAMTGGQPHEGGLTVDMIARQVRAEGVERIAIVTDEPEKYAGKAEFPKPAPRSITATISTPSSASCAR